MKFRYSIFFILQIIIRFFQISKSKKLEESLIIDMLIDLLLAQLTKILKLIYKFKDSIKIFDFT